MIISDHACDDASLFSLLHGDQSSHEYQSALRHVDSCAACQIRLEQMAAESGLWREAQAVLTTSDEPSENVEFAFPAKRRPIAWSESMAKSLLAEPSHPELLGRIGRYDVERLLGSGGMGVVFKAYDIELNRPVAVKLLAPYLAENGSARKRFAREARSAAGVVDDHVVPIYNVESENEPPFLVMQYVAGGSLQETLNRDGPLDVCEILRIGMQTAKGLAAAHAQGLIHRDVKPSNILLDEGVERALLTDFGLARAEDDACLTRSGFQPGTPHYMSPEQVRGEAIDARSDLFSLGCVLYAVCTGHPPFRAETSYAVLRRITDDTARPIRELNPEIPEWLEAIVMKLLSKSREDRFDSAGQIAELLKDCLAHVQHPTTTSLPLPVAILGKSFGRPQTPSAKSLGGFRDRWPPIAKWIAVAGFGFSILLAGVLIVLELNKGTLTIESKVDDVPIRILKDGETVKQLTVQQSGETIRIAAGNYVVVVDSPSNEVRVSDGKVSLRRGENEIVKIVHVSARADVSRTQANSVDFVLGTSRFEPGDNIEIESVTSSGNGFEIGSTVTVTGNYTLDSIESAHLGFYTTVSLSPEEKPLGTPVQPRQIMDASKGTHSFTLSKRIKTTGRPHVSFYHPHTGQGMGGVYFAEKLKTESSPREHSGRGPSTLGAGHENALLVKHYKLDNLPIWSTPIGLPEASSIEEFFKARLPRDTSPKMKMKVELENRAILVSASGAVHDQIEKLIKKLSDQLRSSTPD